MYKVERYLNDDRMPYLVREEVHYTVNSETKWNDPAKVWELCKSFRMTERATESTLLLVFDSACHLICISELSTGSINRSIMSVRDIAQVMLLAGGVNAVIVHNHPSGDTDPSEIDIMVSRKIADGLHMLDMELLDHIVVGAHQYTSMKERDLI